MTLGLVVGGCVEGEKDLGGIAALGNTEGMARVQMDVIGTEADGLNIPRDLDFNPENPGELWVVNRADDSTSTFFDAGTDSQESLHIIDPFALHFMEEVSSIAFGDPQLFGTCQESRNTYDHHHPSDDFMGPTLWTSVLDIYGKTNPEAVEELDYDLGSHIDMLHQTPLCMGIAWEVDNVYWVFDGSTGSIQRNDFVDDHGPGYDHHSDGIIAHYVRGEVARVEDVPSHLAYDAATGLLYIADTGNSRIAVLDTTTGTRGADLPVMEPGTTYYEMDGATLTTLVEGELVEPSGVDLFDDTLIVTDHATGIVWAFDLQGNELDRVDLGLGEGLMGVEVVDREEIWLVHADDNELLRLTPKLPADE